MQKLSIALTDDKESLYSLDMCPVLRVRVIGFDFLPSRTIHLPDPKQNQGLFDDAEGPKLCNSICQLSVCFKQFHHFLYENCNPFKTTTYGDGRWVTSHHAIATVIK